VVYYVGAIPAFCFNSAWHSVNLPYALLADLVLTLHVAIVAFVVLGLIVVPVGSRLGWHWVNALTFRTLHLVTIAVVVAGTWLGIVCPLTTLEMWLRAQAGQLTYPGAFIAHWLHALLFYQAPPWVFNLVYSLFGLVVLAAWWYFPPRRRQP
jgi:hypothetical protein